MGFLCFPQRQSSADTERVPSRLLGGRNGAPGRGAARTRPHGGDELRRQAGSNIPPPDDKRGEAAKLTNTQEGTRWGMCCLAGGTGRGEAGASGPAAGGGSMASGAHSTLRMERFLQKPQLISHLRLLISSKASEPPGMSKFGAQTGKALTLSSASEARGPQELPGQKHIRAIKLKDIRCGCWKHLGVHLRDTEKPRENKHPLDTVPRAASVGGRDEWPRNCQGNVAVGAERG